VGNAVAVQRSRNIDHTAKFDQDDRERIAQGTDSWERIMRGGEVALSARSFIYNGDLSPDDTEKYCKLSAESERIMKSAYNAYGFSARQGRKMQRIARTIADLEGSDEILPSHITEAVSYRKPADILGAGEG
jgi:predicted ATPase with chaperone activity